VQGGQFFELLVGYLLGVQLGQVFQIFEKVFDELHIIGRRK